VRVAVIGSGISGTGAAWLLSDNHTVDLYESERWFGGHARTLDVSTGDRTFPVDTGFMVFNERTYPNLISFFEHLGVERSEADMSFSVQIEEDGIEWSGTSLNTVFAQRRNIANPRFLQMLKDVLRLSHSAERLLADESLEHITLGELLVRERYSESFTDWYLVPMGAAIWSTPSDKMLDYPAASFLRFCDNHGLLHVTGKPMWLSVRGGSRTYVDRALETLSGEAFQEEPVERIERIASGVRVHTPRRAHDYDAVIVASHAPQSLAMLGDAATPEERSVLSAFHYQPNDVVLHTDQSLLPRSRRAWASWNWFSQRAECSKESLVLTYWINNLQSLPADAPPVLETLNAHTTIPEPSTLARLSFDHPLFTAEAIAAQRMVPGIQGIGGIYYTGAWQRYGFHEDGLFSAVRVAQLLGSPAPWTAEAEAAERRSTVGERPGKPVTEPTGGTA
jgi:uncharacterized protein